MTIADVLNANPALQRRLFFLARRFVPGERVDDAIDAVKRLNTLGLSASLDFLGEDVFREEEAQSNASVYREMIRRIAAEDLDANISVKLSAIGQSIDEDLAFTHLDTIIQAARPHDMFIRLDMEGSATVDSTYRMLDRARANYEHIGPVVQAYLHRAGHDVERLIGQRLRVRLCKGAYKEPPEVAIERMALIRRNYVALAEMLLKHGVYPGIATHDFTLIHAVKAFVERERMSRQAFEFQMLYGIRTEAQKALVREGYRMRVYVPFGTHWAGYFYRRLTERKENVLFVLANLFKR
ncbi:MAG: proline dehydrogenase family protein [Candidatus Eremiobacteraeota bacterium]|nr:proline dehydrogenase family protein [Candidatus Eremiobacteraeota bacterium]